VTRPADPTPGPTGRPRRVLVVSHDASRTGAPRVAIQVLGALRDAGWDCHAVLRWGGPLRAEFVSTGAKVSLEPLRRTRAMLRVWRPTRRLATLLEQVSAAVVVALARPDLVWCNTVLSACYVRPARWLGREVVLHCHETEEYSRQVLGRYRLGRYWERVRLVGCGEAVCDYLGDICSVARDDVGCIPSVPDRARVLRLARDPADVPGGAVLVVACGSASTVKGVDLWLELVERVAGELPGIDVRFVWIGGPVPADLPSWSMATGLGGRVVFTGSVANPYPWMAAADIFTLTSRQEQFPLVVLEAMVLGRPVVAFDVGSVAEQLAGTGRLVPAGDVAAAASAVVELVGDRDVRHRLGRAAAARARAAYDFDRFGSQVAATAARAGAPVHGDPVLPTVRRRQS
jgi:glycosyltransferase involved in cell wall biosynthesis